MNRRLLHISKTLALLAVLLLPVEQALAASCCCRGKQSVVASSQGSCCSQGLATCCSTVSTSQRSCCEQGDTRSEPTPCQCPTGCFGQDSPDAVVPARNNASSDHELTLVAVLATSIDVVHGASSDLLRSTVFRTSMSGVQRCVLLCRYRL